MHLESFGARDPSTQPDPGAALSHLDRDREPCARHRTRSRLHEQPAAGDVLHDAARAHAVDPDLAGDAPRVTGITPLLDAGAVGHVSTIGAVRAGLSSIPVTRNPGG